MAIAASLILCFVTGYLLVALAFKRSSANLLLQFCLSAGFGVAVFSLTYFLARVSAFMHMWVIDIGIFAILLAVQVSTKGRKQQPDPSPNDTLSAPKLLSVAFLLTLFGGVYSALRRTLTHPYGSGWDSFAIWNLHARFLYRGGSQWRDGFGALIPWSHPDYPLMLPAAIAHFWTLAGRETAIPAVMGLVFTFATVGVLCSTLDCVAGRTSALLAGMALLCTPFFIELGTWQYSDVPIAFFFLATLVLFHLSDNPLIEATCRPALLALAGFAAGCAAWTKNEGLLFVCAIFLARMFVSSRQRSSGKSAQPLHLLPAFYAVIPVLLVVYFFKHFIAPAGDLFADRAIMLHKLGEVWRYGVVLKWYGKEFLRFGHWLLVPIPLLMLALYFTARKGAPETQSASLSASGLALGLTLAGYFFIYLISPYDLYWHLRFSLSRLFIQIWPSAIFVFFLGLGPLSNRPERE